MPHFPVLPCLRVFLVLGSLAWLSGCAIGGPPAPGASIRAAAPLITLPQVTGSTRNGVPRAQAVTTIGNQYTPARLHIRASTSGDGVRVAPVLYSPNITWRF